LCLYSETSALFACLPGMPSCSEFTASSVYHPSEFTDWRRITLPLPYKTWSSATRFRWIQNYYQEQDEWALDDVYIGQQCPQMCRGHGWCDHGHCRSVTVTYSGSQRTE
ncbi:hypothetical protein cypCar_00048572, partial [Cyprinus carpio]